LKQVFNQGDLNVSLNISYEGGSKSFQHDIQKPHQMENAARDT